MPPQITRANVLPACSALCRQDSNVHMSSQENKVKNHNVLLAMASNLIATCHHIMSSHVPQKGALLCVGAKPLSKDRAL